MKYEVDSIDESIVTLDSYNSDLNLVIDGSNYSAHPLTKEGFAFMWAGARATHGAAKSQFCFEAKVIENLNVSHLPADEPNPHVVRVGFSVDSSSLQLGEDPLSYGYGGTGKISTNCQFKDFGPAFQAGDVILAAVDMDSDPIQIGFAKNGNFTGWAYKVKKSELQGKVLFPHVLTKNCSFEVNFGQRQEPYFKLPDAVKSFSFIGCMSPDLRIGGTRPPAKREDCEMIMMCGLPGAGKSVWAAEHSAKNPDKKYNVLGTNNIIDKMKVMGLPRKRNYAGRWDVLIQMATRCINSMFAIGSKLRRNYVLDQTNVYPTAQARKMRNFDGFKRVAVVVVPSEVEYKRRCDKRDREEGKEIPDSVILEMKANFKLPEVNDIFDEVIFTELQREEAEKLVTSYNEEGKAALGPARKQFCSSESDRQGNFSYNRNDKFESQGNRGGFGGNFRGDHGMRGHNSYGGGRGGFNDRGGFNSSRGGGFHGGRGGGFDRGRSGGFEGGRSGGFDGGRSGGFDGGRSGGFDGGRSGGFEGGRGGGFDSGYGGRDYKAGSGSFGDREGYDGSGSFGDRGGYDNRGSREGLDGSYGGGRGGYDNSMSGGRGNFGSGRGGYDGNRGGSRGSFDGNRGRSSFDNGRGRGGNRGGGRGGYDSNRGVGRGGYDGNRSGGRGGFDNNRGGGRGGHDGNRGGGRGGYDGNRGGGRGGYDNNRGGGRGDFGSRGSSRGDSYDNRSDAYSSYSGSGADTGGSNYGSGYGSDRGYDKGNRSGQSVETYGSSYGTNENIPDSTQRSGYGYSDYSSESYSDQGYGNNSSSDFKRGSSNSRFQQGNRGASRGSSRGGYQNESYSKDSAYSSSYSSLGSTGVQSTYSDKSYGYGTGGYGQSTDTYTSRDSQSSYSSGSQNVKSDGSKFAGSNFDSSSSYSQGTGYSATPARKTRWSAETPTTVAPAVETYTSTTSQSYAYPKSDSSATTTTYPANQTYGYQQAPTLTAAVPQPAVATSVPAAANTAGYAEWMQAQWMQYGQQYYSQ